MDDLRDFPAQLLLELENPWYIAVRPVVDSSRVESLRPRISTMADLQRPDGRGHRHAGEVPC